MLSRIAYRLLLWAALPLIPLRLAWRARRQPEYLRHVGERFGFGGPAADGPYIWIHAVSVGETRAAAPIVARLRESYPTHRILLTHMTPTGRETGEQLFGDGAMRAYLPYDYPSAVARFLDRWRPALGLLMETELWPNLVRGCAGRGVPLLMVNARLSERSARGYARVAGLAREAFGTLAAVGAQTAADAARLRAVGAVRVEVTGSVKFDIAPPAAMLESGAALRRLFGESRRVVLAASTREGEETLILDALAPALAADPLLLAVIVPRHPQRFDEVEAAIRARGLPWQRRSTVEPVRPATSIVLGDSMGEMFAYYAACDVAFLGGSLLPLGGQNLIEACAVGRPVIVGPHTFNFDEATRLAIEAGAVLRVPDAPGMVAAAVSLLGDVARRKGMAEAGLAFCAAHRGATERTLTLVREFLR